MTIAANIAGIIPGLQATALVAENVKHIKMDLKPSKKMGIKPNKMVKLGVTNLLGIGLIKPTAEMINTL